MKISLKNKNLLVIIFEIIIIILGIIGITFATSRLLNNRTATLITADEYNLDYKGDTSITVGDIEPISDSLVNINTRENVIRAEFSVRGVMNNRDEKLIYDVMLNEMNIDCSLLNEYTKWRLYKNGNLLSQGSLSPSFDGDVLTDSMHLTNVQESLPKYNDDYDNYVIIFWISEACEDLNNCNFVDQSNIVNSSLKMNIFIALYSGTKKAYERIPNNDKSCANKPVLDSAMIPVTYKDGEWIVTSSDGSNKDNIWYDYSHQKWANSVIVSGNKKYDVNAVIDKNDVLAWYVWIPRFRYKLWNAGTEITDSYKAYPNGIDIIFENNLNTISNNENDKYLTHPAFGDNLTGFWVSKYEISKDSDNYKFVSDVDAYRMDTVDNYQNIISNLGNTYKLGKDTTSHMINNLEWGAITYLSHSKYGRCLNDGCDKIGINDTYTSGNNKQDTTTRNVYGVYDMAGGSGEYVFGKSVGIGYATNEILIEDNLAWNNTLVFISDRDYIVRGGIGKGLYRFGDVSMDSVENSTRGVIVNK